MVVKTKWAEQKPTRCEQLGVCQSIQCVACKTIQVTQWALKENPKTVSNPRRPNP